MQINNLFSRAQGVLGGIGNTPLVDVVNINTHNQSARIMAKLEGSNPGGSVKDRPAYYMVKKAEEAGQLNKTKTILEPTSGNTGIALAMIGAVLGYKVVLCMSEGVSQERRLILKALGARIILTPAEQGTDGAIREAHKLLTKQPEKYYMPNQFDNPNNTLSHYQSTGPEIWQQTKGKVDFLVAGLGTSGTIIGAGSYLKEQNPNVKIIAVEPIKGHKVQGLKNMKEAIMPKIYNPALIDEIITVVDEDAYNTARELALREGLLVGMSSGAAMAGALKLARKVKAGLIVVILPDRGDRYLSTKLFQP